MRSITTGFAALLTLFVTVNLAFAEPLSPKAQATYESIIRLSREAMLSPDITREKFKASLSKVLDGSEDDQKTARGAAMVMFDTIEFAHESNQLESQFSYAEIFEGSRYKAQSDLIKERDLLKQVNLVTEKTIKSSQNAVARLEEELKKENVSDSRIKAEIAIAKQREIESSSESDLGVKRLKNKIALNQARIEALDYLLNTFGQWQFNKNFNFSNPTQADKFNALIKQVQKQELSFVNGSPTA